MSEYLGLILLVLTYTSSTSGLWDNTTANCTEYRNRFSKHVSKFTNCAITHSRPVTLCESCVNNFIDVNESYNNMTKFSDNDGPCISNYINLDRLQILETMFLNAKDLWSRAKCNECFKLENGRLTTNLSEETATFILLLNETNLCKEKTHNNDTILCTKCIKNYTTLNEYYNTMAKENDKIAGCMDIVDLMNGTRTFFSKKCCKYRRKDEYIFITSTIFMCLITIAFYILTKIYADLKNPAIFKQSRFAESLNQNGS